MKKLKRILAVLLCLVMIQAPIQIFSQTTEVQAAVKREVKYNSKAKKYYYYENGKKVDKRGEWITISGKGTFYMCKDGYAVSAPKEDGVTYNIITKKIGGKTYGFDSKARRVKNGLYYTMRGTCYYFDSKGVYSQKETKKYRPLSPTGNPVLQMKSVTKARQLLDKMSKPKIKNAGSSCVINGGTDYNAIYPHFELQYTKINKTGKMFVTGIWPR